MRKALHILVYGVFALACIGVFSKPQVCAAGVQNALMLCLQTLVPSLLPFMVLAGFFLRSGLCAVCGARLSPFTQRLFRLPGESAGVILLSMVGGFPVGIKMTAQLFRDGQISQKQAARMCLFCINAGPAFLVSAVGSGLYNSTRIGGILYGALCLSALTVGFFLRFFEKSPPVKSAKYKSRVLHIQLSAAFTHSVGEALETTLQICAWVALFGGISSLLAALPMPDSMHRLLVYSFEVTNGVSMAAGRLPLPAVAAILSFGGLAVHCQVLGDLLFCSVRYLHFFCARILGAVLSSLYCFGLLQIFPCEISTFGSTNFNAYAAASVSVPAGMALLLCAVLFLWELESKRKMCYNMGETEHSGGKRNEKERKKRNRAEM